MAITGQGGGGLGAASSQFFLDFVPEVWTEGIRYYFQKNLVYGALSTDWSSEVVGGGDVVNIPRINEQGADSLALGGSITWSANTTAEGKDTLTINNHHYAGILIEDVAKVQSSTDLMSKYAQEMGYALAKKIDVTIEAGFASAADNSIELSGSTTGKFAAKADVTGLLKVLAENDIDYLDGQTVLVLSPTLYSSIFELDEFASADSLGVSNGPRVKGWCGTLLGIPVYVSTVMTAGTYGYMFHKSFNNTAFSIAPRVQEQYDVDYLGTKIVTDAVWGFLGKDENATGKRRCWKLLDAS
jgi:hypothetical protein